MQKFYIFFIKNVIFNTLLIVLMKFFKRGFINIGEHAKERQGVMET